MREETILTIKRYIPGRIWKCGQFVYRLYRKVKYNIVNLPNIKAETSKAHDRRKKELFFDKYCQGKGLDIGYGGDLLGKNCKGWDMEQGNAQTLKGLRDCSFDFVYSGHTLEHMEDPALALKNWWRVVTVGGYLILYVPHRDLYEKKKTLPSQWNPDHKHFFLPDHDDPPDTLGLQQLIQKTISNYKVEYSRVCDEGYESFGNDTHSKGEYSIEIVLKKTGITCAE